MVTEKAANTIETFDIGRNGRARGGVAHASAAKRRSGSTSRATARSSSPRPSAARPAPAPSPRTTLPAAPSPRHVVEPRPSDRGLLGRDNARRALRLRHQHRLRLRLRLCRDRQGALALLRPDGITGETGTDSKPTDADLTRGDRFLYTLDARTGQISGFAVAAERQPRPDRQHPHWGLARRHGRPRRPASQPTHDARAAAPTTKREGAAAAAAFRCGGSAAGWRDVAHTIPWCIPRKSSWTRRPDGIRRCDDRPAMPAPCSVDDDS